MTELYVAFVKVFLFAYLFCTFVTVCEAVFKYAGTLRYRRFAIGESGSDYR